MCPLPLALRGRGFVCIYRTYRLSTTILCSEYHIYAIQEFLPGVLGATENDGGKMIILFFFAMFYKQMCCFESLVDRHLETQDVHSTVSVLDTGHCSS
jgi:hypothetical protein